MEVLRLQLSPNAEEVAMVRQAMSGVGEALGMSPRMLSDVKLATSEACTNAIVHGFAEADRAAGSLIVFAVRHSETLAVTVQDNGRGIQPSIGGEGLGLGLPLIAALSRSVSIAEGPAGGTAVEMTFDLVEEHAP